VYGAGFMIARIPLLTDGRKNEATFYRRHGDWFGWGCLMVSALWLGRQTLLRYRHGQREAKPE
jgi:apolipoprotein N-acyltransferase